MFRDSPNSLNTPTSEEALSSPSDRIAHLEAQLKQSEAAHVEKDAHIRQLKSQLTKTTERVTDSQIRYDSTLLQFKCQRDHFDRLIGQVVACLRTQHLLSTTYFARLADILGTWRNDRASVADMATKVHEACNIMLFLATKDQTPRIDELLRECCQALQLHGHEVGHLVFNDTQIDTDANKIKHAINELIRVVKIGCAVIGDMREDRAITNEQYESYVDNMVAIVAAHIAADPEFDLEIDFSNFDRDIDITGWKHACPDLSIVEVVRRRVTTRE